MDSMERHRQTGECHTELRRLARHIESAVKRMHAAHMDGWVDELSYISEAILIASDTINGNAARDVNESIQHSEAMNRNMVLAAIGAATSRPSN